MRICTWICLVVCLMGMGGATIASADPKPAHNLRVSTIAPAGSSFHKSFQDLGEKWRNAPGGGVNLEIFAGTQGGEPTLVRRMNPRVAQLDGAMLTALGMGQIDRSAAALQLMPPTMFQTWEEVDYVRERLRPQLEKRFADKGYIVLFWADAGWVRWFSKQPVLRPADLKPLRVYAASGDPEAVEMMKAYYTPVVLEPDKILNSLQTGMINAIPIPAFLANFLQVAGQTGHMLDMNYAPVVGAMVVTRRAWDKLPPETQAYLRQTAEAAGEEIRQNSRAEDLAAIVAMREKQRLQVHALPPGAEAEWRAEFAKLHPRIRGTLVPADLFDEVVSALQDFRGSPPAAR